MKPLWQKHILHGYPGRAKAQLKAECPATGQKPGLRARDAGRPYDRRDRGRGGRRRPGAPYEMANDMSLLPTAATARRRKKPALTGGLW